MRRRSLAADRCCVGSFYAENKKENREKRNAAVCTRVRESARRRKKRGENERKRAHYLDSRSGGSEARISTCCLLGVCRALGELDIGSSRGWVEVACPVSPAGIAPREETFRPRPAYIPQKWPSSSSSSSSFATPPPPPLFFLWRGCARAASDVTAAVARIICASPLYGLYACVCVCIYRCGDKRIYWKGAREEKEKGRKERKGELWSWACRRSS